MEEELMKTIVKRFLNFAKNEKTRKYWAIAFYIGYIISITVNIPTKLNIVYKVFTILCYILFFIYFIEYIERIVPLSKTPIELFRSFIEELYKIFKELLMFVPVWCLFIYIKGILISGIPVNQSNINEITNKVVNQGSSLDFISWILIMVIFGPIMEEFIFRFLPYKFINNKIIYVILSSFVFAGMHVIHDPKAYYYIWCYILNPIYYAYRYHKTKDIWVPASMHIFNNFVATLPTILAYF